MKNMSRVILVGRTNVGKSALFNRLSSSVKSIIFDTEGVTRDYIKDVVSWQDASFELVDSAGLGFKKQQDPLAEKIRLSALSLFESSQILVFVVDGTTGLLPEDFEIAKAIRKSGKKVIVAINKMDTKRAQEQVHEFARLGFPITIPISAMHGTGMRELLDAMVTELATVSAPMRLEEPQCKVVLLGKPNVGKSSLMNALLQEERSIVTDIPGTTREAISERIQFSKETIELTDTPGVRRKRSIDQELEGLMVKSALSAVRQADIILLLLDASQGIIADQELKLAYYAFDEQKKGVVILFNKQDLVTAQQREDLDHSLEGHEHLMRRLGTMNISVKDGKNIGKILPLVQEIWQRTTKKFSDSELQLLFKTALQHTPLYKGGKQLPLINVKQTGTTPITIALYVHEPELYGPSQMSFFENVLRKHTDLRGAPVRIVVRKV